MKKKNDPKIIEEDLEFETPYIKWWVWFGSGIIFGIFLTILTLIYLFVK